MKTIQIVILAVSVTAVIIKLITSLKNNKKDKSVGFWGARPKNDRR